MSLHGVDAARSDTTMIRRAAGRRPPQRPAERPGRPTTPARPRSAVLRDPGPVSGTVSACRHHRPRRARAAAPDGRFTAPELVAVFNSLPSGSRRARSQVDALRAWELHPGRLTLRADRDRRTGDVYRVLVNGADWSTMTWTGTWDAVAEHVGVSRSTVARAVRWLRDAGLLGVVHTGASAAVLGGDTNRAPTYVLAVPHDGDVSAAHDPVEETDTPPVSGFDLRNQIARENLTTNRAPLRGGESSTTTEQVEQQLATAPASKRDRLAVCEALRWWDPMLRRLSGRMLRHLLRPWLDAGWTGRDVLYAVNQRPDGEPWRHTGTVRTPAAWLRHRLRPWLDEGGQPVPSRSQRAAAASLRPRVVREARSWRADLDGRRVDPAASRGAALARAIAQRAAARPHSA